MTEFTRGLLAGGLIGLLPLAILCALLVRSRRRFRDRLDRAVRRLREIHHRRVARLQGAVARSRQLAEVGTLTGGLAHEIKNPLSTVQLNLQLLQEDFDPQNPAYGRLTNRLSTVQRETSRLRDILDDFLRYAGKIELARKPTDLNLVLEELTDFFAPQAQVNRVQIRFKPASQPVMASVDPRLIKQAVLNLMINAVQAMPEGGELILSVADAKEDVLLEIIDTGPGIPAQAVERIFQAYYSTKRGGTGLGLAMTRRIIEEHGGQITVRSEVGKGTDFVIRLPKEAP